MSAALQFEPVPRRTSASFVAQPGAYRWWYFDAVSDDGQTSLVVIFFLGSVFSPYYAGRLARGEQAFPSEHAAINVALYGPKGHLAWCFSEYGDARFLEHADGVRVADSSFQRLPGGRYVLELRDRRTFTGRPVRGTVTFDAEDAPLTAEPVALATERHQWRCHSPAMRVNARFSDPALRFEGHGYHDENWGSEPPARALRSWSWVRGRFGRRSRVVFDAVGVDGARSLLTVDSKHGVSTRRLAPRVLRPARESWLLPLPSSFEAGTDDEGAPQRLGAHRFLERAPFYARFLAPFPSPAGGAPAVGVGEHVDFTRFATGLVRFLVGFRIARPDLGDRGLLP